ncbi:MAG TPA: helix-turn-helix transcriptional regulator [Casimicrobiaceae bacterium]|nr:helix-turn-helix transcriptional regulator [Casimicrobiaceae bacterium]
MRLKGSESYHELARKMQAAGLNVTAQGLHKWMNGGGITAENLQDIARYFGVSPAYLYFGEPSESNEVNDDDGLSREARLVAKAWSLLPERFAVPLALDTFKLFEALIDKDDQRPLHVEVKQALERLTKGS